MGVVGYACREFSIAPLRLNRNAPQLRDSSCTNEGSFSNGNAPVARVALPRISPIDGILRHCIVRKIAITLASVFGHPLESWARLLLSQPGAIRQHQRQRAKRDEFGPAPNARTKKPPRCDQGRVQGNSPQGGQRGIVGGQSRGARDFLREAGKNALILRDTRSARPQDERSGEPHPEERPKAASRRARLK